MNEWMINTNTWKCNPVRGKEQCEFCLSGWNQDHISPTIFCFIPYSYVLLFHNVLLVCLSACLFHFTLSSLRDSTCLAVLSPVSNIQDGRTLISPLLVSSQRGAGMSVFLLRREKYKGIDLLMSLPALPHSCPVFSLHQAGNAGEEITRAPLSPTYLPFWVDLPSEHPYSLSWPWSKYMGWAGEWGGGTVLPGLGE